MSGLAKNRPHRQDPIPVVIAGAAKQSLARESRKSGLWSHEIASSGFALPAMTSVGVTVPGT
jgi:hypothetical protein